MRKKYVLLCVDVKSKSREERGEERAYAPGPVSVLSRTPVSLPIWCFTNAYSAMSIAKQISVSRAARNDASEAKRVTVTCEERERRSARNVRPQAGGRV